MALTLSIDRTFETSGELFEWARRALPLESLNLSMGDNWDAFEEILSECAATIVGGIELRHASHRVIRNGGDNRLYWGVIEDMPDIARQLGGSFRWSIEEIPEERAGGQPGIPLR